MEQIDFVEDCFFIGEVAHKRSFPFSNFFKYKVSYFWFDINKKPKVNFFKFNRFSLFSFYDSDHGERNRDKSQSLFDYYQENLREFNYNNIKTIKMLCLPRILNYSFNPISIIACYNRKKKCEVFICEVSNTFGERHAYLFNVKRKFFHTKKFFYVSPFLEVEGDYKIEFFISENFVKLEVLYKKEDKQVLYANFLGEKRKLNTNNFFKYFFIGLLQNFKVTFGIYFEALKLSFKGAIYKSKPEKPKNFYSMNKKQKINNRKKK